MTDLTRLTANELVSKLGTREITSEAVTQAYLDRIAEVDGMLNAYLALNEHALDDARRIDERRAAGEELHPLAGVPVAIKDVLVTSDMPTTASSRILEGYRSPFDATVVTKAREAGMVILGKTNMDEFAMGSSTETSAFGPTHNPWDLERVPGGSGGGSAAAIAAFTAPLAFGSDTGGSIRQPGALTGTVGMKPTYGSVSRYGAIALGSSLDQIGPCARTVHDAALMHDVMSGYDPHEATSLNREWPAMVDASRDGADPASLQGLRIGLFNQFTGEGIQPGVQEQFDAMVAMLTERGATVTVLDAPELTLSAAVYLVLMSAEASSNLAKFDSVRFGLRVEPAGAATVEDVMSASREAGFGHEVKRRLLLGTHVLSAENFDRLFIGSQKVRTQIQRAFEQAFTEVDVVLTPSSATTAQRIGERVSTESATMTDSMLAAANLAGLPALNVPIGTAAEDGLPVGVQVIAAATDDARTYRVGAAIEALVTERDGIPFWQSIPTLSRKESA